MSASREKQTRQGKAVSSLGSPKTAREAQQQKEEKRANRVYALVGILFVLIAAVTLIWKSNIIQKTATAVTINGEKYTAAEVNYYYQNTYQNFLSNYSSYLSYFGLDTTKDLKTQECAMGDEGDTWFDYFMNEATTQMSAVQALNDAADKAGYDDWNDSLQTSFDSTMKSLETNATTYGYSVSQYLKRIYGTSMTQSVYEKQLKAALRASAYSTEYSNSLTYTDDEINTAYKANPNSFDVVDYQVVRVSGSPASTTDSDGNTVDPTDEEKAAAMATAKATANSIYASYQAGGNLSDLADGNDAATYTDGAGGTYSSGVLYDWLFDTTRKSGDSAVLEDTDSSMYYVVAFSKRYRNDYNTVDVRHILLKVDDSSLDSSSDTYDTDLQTLKDDVKKKAEDLLAQWKAGDATEDSFAELANENSEDSGSNTNGGLYEQVYKGEMVTDFNDWCFDDSRQSGDTGIVYGETSSYKGYHIVYFVGEDLPYWKVQVTNSLKSNDYNTWYSDLTKDYTAEQHNLGMKFVG